MLAEVHEYAGEGVKRARLRLRSMGKRFTTSHRSVPMRPRDDVDAASETIERNQKTTEQGGSSGGVVCLDFDLCGVLVCGGEIVLEIRRLFDFDSLRTHCDRHR